MVFRPLYYQCLIIEKTLELLNFFLKFKEKNRKTLRRVLEFMQNAKNYIYLLEQAH